MNDSPPTTPSSANVSTGSVDWEAKYHEVSELLQETRAELDEFQTSSKELEEELERELESTEQQMTDLRNRVERVERERDDCKNKLTTLQGTHNTTVNSLQRELDALRQQHALIKVQLRELEVGNDDLERSEREVSSSLADLEGRYARALEEKILLEHELQDRVALEEDMQRLRDELRDASEESTILKEQNTRLSEQHCALDEQNKSLSEELSHLREELAQARHLAELARSQPQFPSTPSTAPSSAKSTSSHDSRSPTPSAASRTSDDLQLEDLVPKSAPPSLAPEPKPEPASANVTPRAKSAIPVSPSARTLSVTRRPGTGIAVPTVLRTPNAHATIRSRPGLGQSTNGTPDPLRRSTTLPALSSPVPTRLPTARNSPALGPLPVTPRPRMAPNGLGTSSGLNPVNAVKRGTAVQMVGEMRARVRTLEQKINRPLVEQQRSFTSERTERKRTSFSSDRSRRSTNDDPPPSAFRGVPTPSPSQTEFPTMPSGRTTPASTVGSNRVVVRTNGGGPASGRSTPGLGISASSGSLFGLSIRRPQSRNASHGNPTRTGIAPALPSIPSLSRIPSSPLPGTSDLELPGRPTTPIGLTMLPVPTDRSPSKSDNFAIRRSTRKLSLHPAGPGGYGTATSPSLPAGLTGGDKQKASSVVGGTRKPASPPARASVSPPASGKNGMGASQSMLGMSRIGRPNSLGLSSSKLNVPVPKEKEAAKSGRFRSGSVGWGRDR
ncbi:NADH:ubiquinone oxidoreductase [Ceratobasidium sp. 392]|nr:NADH:ubiquinone oxidoreductase [Ceratobasidium sp. 392]